MDSASDIPAITTNGGAMKLKTGKRVNHVFHVTAMLPATVLSIGLTVPAQVAHATIASMEEIVVTARRTEEVVQDIPISMTVFNQDMLTERNVSNGADLATYTPSLAVNTRFGAEQTTFAIRGFTQELRTTASVAVYFADVVAPRGGGSVTAGDGAGPGSFFDLQNVQVLKGPQGTLFGRNTTGGAIQLVPQEPTNKFEGYIDGSVGNYHLRREQGVLNVPITDHLRARFGVDRETRDGYLNNISGVGPDRLANVNYVAGRASVMWDITNDIRNYTVYSYSYSHNRGNIQQLFHCDTASQLGNFFCGASYSKWTQAGSKFYDVISDTPDPLSMLRQWQLIDTLTWDISDALSVKNNLSFAHLTQSTRGSIFGNQFSIFGTPAAFIPAGTYQGRPTNSQKTFVEELQFQGIALHKDLTWQAGLYFENSRPDGISGAMAPNFGTCTGLDSSNPAVWNCQFPLLGAGLGSLVTSSGTIEYKNLAAYTQETYDISDEFRVTLGLRYTVDKTNGESQEQAFDFNADGTPATPAFHCIAAGGDPSDKCSFKMHQRSEAPTWLIDFDYLPSPDAMVYAKYARGYRQGAVSIFAPDGLQEFEPEKVDAYEIGTKTTFHGLISGTFNVAAFYNELSNQQLQANYTPCGLTTTSPECQGQSGAGLAATTAILNAGSSTIQGLETETTLKLTKDLTFSLSYTYLSTHLNSLAPTPLAAGYAGGANNAAGTRLTFSPTHSLTTGLSYHLPVPASLGEMSVGGSYTFVSDQDSCSDILSPYCKMPSHRLVSMNADWKSIAGTPLDAGLFATNLLNEKITNYVSGLYDSAGSEYRVVGEPRMFGARLRYNF